MRVVLSFYLSRPSLRQDIAQLSVWSGEGRSARFFCRMTRTVCTHLGFEGRCRAIGFVLASLMLRHAAAVVGSSVGGDCRAFCATYLFGRGSYSAMSPYQVERPLVGVCLHNSNLVARVSVHKCLSSIARL